MIVAVWGPDDADPSPKMEAVLGRLDAAKLTVRVGMREGFDEVARRWGLTQQAKVESYPEASTGLLLDRLIEGADLLLLFADGSAEQLMAERRAKDADVRVRKVKGVF